MLKRSRTGVDASAVSKITRQFFIKIWQRWRPIQFCLSIFKPSLKKFVMYSDIPHNEWPAKSCMYRFVLRRVWRMVFKNLWVCFRLTRINPASSEISSKPSSFSKHDPHQDGRALHQNPAANPRRDKPKLDERQTKASRLVDQDKRQRVNSSANVSSSRQRNQDQGRSSRPRGNMGPSASEFTMDSDQQNSLSHRMGGGAAPLLRNHPAVRVPRHQRLWALTLIISNVWPSPAHRPIYRMYTLIDARFEPSLHTPVWGDYHCMPASSQDRKLPTCNSLTSRYAYHCDCLFLTFQSTQSWQMLITRLTFHWCSFGKFSSLVLWLVFMRNRSTQDGSWSCEELGEAQVREAWACSQKNCRRWSQFSPAFQDQAHKASYKRCTASGGIKEARDASSSQVNL